LREEREERKEGLLRMREADSRVREEVVEGEKEEA